VTSPQVLLLDEPTRARTRGDRSRARVDRVERRQRRRRTHDRSSCLVRPGLELRGSAARALAMSVVIDAAWYARRRRDRGERPPPGRTSASLSVTALAAMFSRSHLRRLVPGSHHVMPRTAPRRAPAGDGNTLDLAMTSRLATSCSSSQACPRTRVTLRKSRSAVLRGWPASVKNRVQWAVRTNPMPRRGRSRAHVSGSLVHSEYSLCSAVTGCTACAARWWPTTPPNARWRTCRPRPATSWHPGPSIATVRSTRCWCTGR